MDREDVDGNARKFKKKNIGWENRSNTIRNVAGYVSIICSLISRKISLEFCVKLL